ncbi:DUF881 domain-containing protein [Aeromicrobium wangtongii]|uniref:DUF881 domain-containing protein n=1 Tax=Aeromicrobium wangtongii TaxID=2969247 RepID=A0ABY5M1Q8_9ACTN|nr:DUF881 domain-containing protein [Aeromicrobium wangtongii]MCD9198111.1 DUF881 domain-containing protein [Aeromicrobium wangtongii]MCL3819171.1 DUF881 domain-containing protein [Aeromicrobium wangtongii]UUP12150.1 DUF881 domain-containing protein [Aeromicrobium wangtongii]
MPESRRATPATSGWRGLLRPKASQVIVALLIGGLAFAITVQINDAGTDDYSGARSEELVELLKSLDVANERLGTQIQDLTETRNGLLSSTRRSERAEKQAKQRADQLAILAGTAGATGSGIELTINDPDEQIDAAALLDAVEELRDAGAEVIAINGVARVVAQTYFLDDDNQIRVGGREVKRPYVIEAIGDPKDLAEAVRFRGGLIDRVANRGGSAFVKEKKKITITALADVKSPEYARPTS